MTKITMAGIATGLVLLLSTLVWLGPVVVGVTLGVILMITLVTLLLIAGGPSTTTSTAANTLLTKIRDNWKAVARAAAILIGCHLLVWYFWQVLWSGLASNFVFWLDHVVLLIAFLFFREADKKGKKGFVPGTSWVLAILLIGNIWTAWGWSESYYSQARQKAIAEYQQAIVAQKVAQKARIAALPTEIIAPVGGWSEQIPILNGTIIRGEAGKPILIRDDKGVIHQDNGDGRVKDLFTSTYVEVQSGITEPVKVTVSR